MITYTKLGRHGRLGNQLFQIASTIGIAQTLKQSVGFPDWDYRPYFQVPDVFWPPKLIRDEWPTINADKTALVEHMDPRCREYLQDIALFETVKKAIWQWFQPSELAMETLRSYEWFAELPRPILSVHVRRGDNAASPNSFHPLRPMSYYEEAIESLRGQFESICFFSDDIEWCRSNFGDYAVEYETAFFVGGQPRAKEHEKEYLTEPISDWIDLQMMSRCDLHILSNSTYAFWGAWLSHDPAPIYPWPFFGPSLDYIDTSLIFPDFWVRHNHGQIYAA